MGERGRLLAELGSDLEDCDAGSDDFGKDGFVARHSQHRTPKGGR